jgi:hypothetical protein
MVVLDEYGNSHHRPEIDVMSAQAAFRAVWSRDLRILDARGDQYRPEV